MKNREGRLGSAGERNPEVLVLLSGGIDSAACVDFYQSLNRPLCAVHVDYGQNSARHERLAAERIAAYYGLRLDYRRLDRASAKLIGEVPGRNAFLVLTAVMERPESVRAIVLGIHAGTQYADCSGAFVDGLNSLLRLHGLSVELLAPFLEWSKADILRYCELRSVPTHLTYSCEKGGDMPCGKCLSCLDRRCFDASA